MDETAKLTGKCMCGAVGIAGTTKKPELGACHCKMCRRWCSGPFFAVTCQDVCFEGEADIARIRSSDWAERGFCRQCGSNLFYHIIDSEEFHVAAGIFDEESKLHLSMQVFIDSKPPYYTLADKTETMTAAEVFAIYGAPPD